MACRGVLFALTENEEAKLLAASSADTVIELVTEEMEGSWDEDWLQEMDKSWDAIHRCLGHGSLKNSQPSISARAVLGGRQLSDRDDWIISYLSVDEVKGVSAELASIEKSDFRQRYFGLRKKFLWFDITDYAGPIDEEDFEYSWSYFEDMRRFYSKAAQANRATVFSVEQ